MPAIIRRLHRAVALLALAAALVPGALLATNYSITTLADGVAVDGVCTLREAIRAAGTNAAVNECSAGGAVDRIELAAVGTYGFTLGQEDLVFVPGSLTIRGLSGFAANHRIDLGGQNRFLVLISSAVELGALTISNGGPAANLPNGGAISAFSTQLVASGVVFEGCRAQRGGALSVDGGTTTLDAVIFSGNRAEETAGSAAAAGGGVFARIPPGASIVLRGVRFEDNAAASAEAGSLPTGGGAALSVEGSAIFTRVELLGNVVEGAAPGEGGGLYLEVGESGAVELEDLLFTGNGNDPGAPSFADALFAEVDDSATFALRRARIQGNGAGVEAGVQARIAASGSATVLIESALFSDGPQDGAEIEAAADATILLGGLTVAGNEGVGLRLSGLSTAPLRLENSLLWGNVAPGSLATDLEAAGNVESDRVANRNWIGDQGDPDPHFVDAPNGDYSLQSFSGAVEAGDATFEAVGRYDANHAPRVVGDEIDLGAFERGALFGDDFEAGSTGAWSSWVP